MDSKEYLKRLFLDAMDRCSPGNAVDDMLSLEGSVLTIAENRYSLEDRPIYLFATGKASVAMFEAASMKLASRVHKSVVVTSDGSEAQQCSADEVLVGAHPTPDASSVKAGQTARNFFKYIPSNALLITLISGGTSSLLCLPPKGISIADIEKTFKLLNESGATIREINTVRKHCSQIKGGQLLQLLDPRVQLIDLVISDVPDDDLSLIGSGPTVEDPSTFLEARQILQQYELWNRLPHSVRNHITDGIEQKVSETLKPGSDPLDTHTSHVISSARKLAQTIGALASLDGLDCQVADGPFNEDVRLVANEITNTIAANKRTKLFVFYGESTVTVTGRGKGGRNQELALHGALQIEGKKQFTWLCAGTDGIDGPTDAAGAIVDGQTISKAREQGLDPQKYLANNDSYHFHKEMGTLFKTGPTGNNLMDVVLIKVSD